MQEATQPPLTFALLDAQIEALPEGPISTLRSPRWTRPWTFVGLAGIALGLLPSLLILWMEPRHWMVVLARGGLVITLIGFGPGFIRNLWTLLREFRRHREGFVEQFDHDVEQFREFAGRLASYPRQILESQARYARLGQDRLGSRLVTMLGGIERLGVLPLLLSAIVVLRNWSDLTATPTWLVALALMAAWMWIVGWCAAEFRRRLQLYEFLLEEALRQHADTLADESKTVQAETGQAETGPGALPCGATKGAEGVKSAGPSIA
jgi:hypothetical protein